MRLVPSLRILLAGSLALAPWAAQAATATAAKTEAKVETKIAPKADSQAAPKAEAPAADAKAEAKADTKAGDSAKAGSADKGGASHKSAGIAEALAIVPGVVVHGSGHMYAGSWMKGLGLLAIEGAAIGIGYTTVNNGYNDIQKVMDGTKNGAIPTNVGSAYQSIGVGLVCSMAFLWTWFDDMAGAPIAVSEYNRLADEDAAQAHLQVMPTGDGAMLALVRRF